MHDWFKRSRNVKWGFGKWVDFAKVLSQHRKYLSSFKMQLVVYRFEERPQRFYEAQLFYPMEQNFTKWTIFLDQFDYIAMY